MGILDRAELLLQAKNYSGTGDWLDESGNSHDAQLGSTSGADTNDPVFKAYDPDDGVYVNLPGSTGNYLSMPDTNLLDADTAHLQQSLGGWVPAGGNSGVSLDGEHALIGDTSLLVTANGTGDSIISAGAGGQTAIDPSTVYAGNLSLWVAESGLEAFVTVQWRDGGGAYVGQMDTTIPLTPGAWTAAPMSGTSVATAAFARPTVNVRKVGGAAPDDGTKIWTDAVIVRSGSDATFVPSLRIVGDLDLECDMDTDWDVAGVKRILDQRTGAGLDGYSLYLNSGALGQAYGDGSSARAAQVSLGSPTGRHKVRATFTKSLGSWDRFLDGVSLGPVNTGSTLDGSPSDNPLYVGAVTPNGTADMLAADVYSATVRDGIDGPIVAQFDASDASEPWATVADSESGQDWTVNRSSSGYVSTFVDRDMFLLSTDDRFVVSHHADLEFGAADDFTIIGVAAFAESAVASGQRIATKRDTEGWALYESEKVGTSSGRFYLDGDPSDVTVDPQAVAVPNNVLHAYAGRRIAGVSAHVFVDGVKGPDYVDPGSDLTTSASPPLYIGGTPYMDGQIVAVALFREALTDAEIVEVGELLTATVEDAATLHGDALQQWILNTGYTVTEYHEIVGMLNELNGTEGVEYAEARGTFLGVDPAG